ncbi:MAG: extracellular solute-binding protein [bacterium]
MNQDQNKFKVVLTGVFVFFILIGLIAFSTYKSNSPTSSNVEINVWGTIDKSVFNNYISKYQQDKKIQFKLAYTYKSLDTIDSQLVEAIATGKAPDAILIPQTLEKRYSDKVYMITSIPERTFKDTFVQESDLYIQPTGIFALPFFVDPLVMYWNRDIFSSAGIAVPPTKWTEFPLLAEKLSQSDGNANIIKSMAPLGEFKNIDNAKALLSTLIMQAGSPIVSIENGRFKSKLNYKSSSDIMIPTVSALQFFTDYSNPKKSVYSWNRSLPRSKQFFLSEDLAIYFGFASEYNDIKEKNPNLNFDVAMMPQILDAKAKITYGELYGFAILKSSRNVTATFSLLSLLIGSDSISSLIQIMDVSPVRRDIISIGSPDPVKTVFFNSALISRGWIDPDSSKTDQIFQDMVENITTGKTDLQGSVSKASMEIDNLLQ